MSFNEMRNKPVEDWTIEEIKAALLTTDGIGLKLKIAAFNKLVENIDVTKFGDKKS